MTQILKKCFRTPMNKPNPLLVSSANNYLEQPHRKSCVLLISISTLTRGMCAWKSLIGIDWVVQLTLTHSCVLCAVDAFTSGYCHRSFSRYRTIAPVLTAFTMHNWIELFLNQKPVFSPPLSFFILPFKQWLCVSASVNIGAMTGRLWCENVFIYKVTPTRVSLLNAHLPQRVFT